MSINIDRVLGVEQLEYPEDVKRLKREIPMLKRYTYAEIQQLYKAYSDDACAGWLIVDESGIESFADWLKY